MCARGLAAGPDGSVRELLSIKSLLCGSVLHGKSIIVVVQVF